MQSKFPGCVYRHRSKRYFVTCDKYINITQRYALFCSFLENRRTTSPDRFTSNRNFLTEWVLVERVSVISLRVQQYKNTTQRHVFFLSSRINGIAKHVLKQSNSLDAASSCYGSKRYPSTCGCSTLYIITVQSNFFLASNQHRPGNPQTCPNFQLSEFLLSRRCIAACHIT